MNALLEGVEGELGELLLGDEADVGAAVGQEEDDAHGVLGDRLGDGLRVAELEAAADVGAAALVDLADDLLDRLAPGADGPVRDLDVGLVGERHQREIVGRGQAIDERARGVAGPGDRLARHRSADVEDEVDREVRPLGGAVRGGAEREADVERAAAGRELGALEVGAKGQRGGGRRGHRQGVAGADVADDLALGGGDDAARDGGLEGGEVAAAGAVGGGEAAVGVDRDEGGSGAGVDAAFPATPTSTAPPGAGPTCLRPWRRPWAPRGSRNQVVHRARPCPPTALAAAVAAGAGPSLPPSRFAHPRIAWPCSPSRRAPDDQDRHPHMPSRLHASPRHPPTSLVSRRGALRRASSTSVLEGSPPSLR